MIHRGRDVALLQGLCRWRTRNPLRDSGATSDCFDGGKGNVHFVARRGGKFRDVLTGSAGNDIIKSREGARDVSGAGQGPAGDRGRKDRIAKGLRAGSQE